MKPACTFHLNSSTLFAYEITLVLSSADIFFQNQFVVVVVFSIFFLVISVECQAVWIQIMPIGSDLGLNCLQRLSEDDTSK